MKKLTKRAIAAALGVSAPAFTRYVARGCPTWSLAAARTWQAQHVHPAQRLAARTAEGDTPATQAPQLAVEAPGISYAEARRREAVAAAGLREIELQRVKREVAPVAAMAVALAAACARAAALLDAVPGDLRRRFPELDAAALDRVDVAITAARAEIAAANFVDDIEA